MCSIPARFVAEQVGQRTTQLRVMQNAGTLVDVMFRSRSHHICLRS